MYVGADPKTGKQPKRMQVADCKAIEIDWWTKLMSAKEITTLSEILKGPAISLFLY